MENFLGKFLRFVKTGYERNNKNKNYIETQLLIIFT